MKKRIQTLMFMTLMSFLFLGLTTVNAQSSISAGPVILNDAPDNRDQIQFQDVSDALVTVQTELQTNYDLNNPVEPNNAVNAAVYYRMFYLRAVEGHLTNGAGTTSAIFQGYNNAIDAAKASYPDLINETWRTEMITLLSL